MNEITVFFNIGHEKYFGVDKYGNLISYATKDGIITDYINLGRITPARAAELKTYIDRLAIHGPRN